MNSKSVHRFSHHAMASIFTITIAGEDAVYAKKAAARAFREIDEVEASLSRFRHDSDISRINRLNPGEIFRPSLHGANCLGLARAIWQSTGGAFDPAIGALLEWRANHPGGEDPPEDIRERCGMAGLLSNGNHTEISTRVAGLRLDLGAIGKGYGVDVAAQLLREDWDIQNALVQGGESSMAGWGDGIDGSGWPLCIRDPEHQDEALADYDLVNHAVSGSGQLLHGAHILDPRTGRVVMMGHAAWACASQAAVADALSTALMVMDAAEAIGLLRGQEEVGALLVDEGGRLLELGTWGRSGVIPSIHSSRNKQKGSDTS